MMTKGRGIFKVICTSIGGSPLTMGLSGPSGTMEMWKINEVGNIEGMGNDTFSAEAIRQNGRDGDFYTCLASNGVSNISSIFILRGLSLLLGLYTMTISMCFP